MADVLVSGTVPLPGEHSFMEGALRPVRVAIAGDTGIGDSLPRSQPTFAAWSNLAALAVAFNFAVAGAWLAAVFDQTSEMPVLVVLIGCALMLGLTDRGSHALKGKSTAVQVYGVCPETTASR